MELTDLKSSFDKSFIKEDGIKIFHVEKGAFLKNFSIKNVGKCNYIFQNRILYTLDQLGKIKSGKMEILKEFCNSKNNKNRNNKIDIKPFTKIFYPKVFIFFNKSPDDLHYFIVNMLPLLRGYLLIKATNPDTKLLMLDTDNRFILNILKFFSLDIDEDVIWMDHNKNKPYLVGAKDLYYCINTKGINFLKGMIDLVSNKDAILENKNKMILVESDVQIKNELKTSCGFIEFNMKDEDLKNKIRMFKNTTKIVLTDDSFSLDHMYWMPENTVLYVICDSINERYIKLAERLNIKLLIIEKENSFDRILSLL
jgi:hypothetical protein